MPKFYFDYTNYKGRHAFERQTFPMQIRYGTSQWHEEPQWLMLGVDLDKSEQREYAMRDMTNVRPSFTMYLVSKDALRSVVARLEEIVRLDKTKVVDASPSQIIDAVGLAKEALKVLARDTAEDDIPAEQAERLYLPPTMPDDLASVLGTHPVQAISFAEAARAAGIEIPPKAESEWAFIHWHALNHYLRRKGAPEWKDDLNATFAGFIATAQEILAERMKGTPLVDDGPKSE